MRPKAHVREGRNDRLLHRAQVRDHVGDPHDRIADELARPVVGQLAAAVDVDDVDPLRAVEVLAERQLAGWPSVRPRV